MHGWAECPLHKAMFILVYSSVLCDQAPPLGFCNCYLKGECRTKTQARTRANRKLNIYTANIKHRKLKVSIYCSPVAPVLCQTGLARGRAVAGSSSFLRQHSHIIDASKLHMFKCYTCTKSSSTTWDCGSLSLRRHGDLALVI